MAAKERRASNPEKANFWREHVAKWRTSGFSQADTVGRTAFPSNHWGIGSAGSNVTDNLLRLLSSSPSHGNTSSRPAFGKKRGLCVSTLVIASRWRSAETFACRYWKSLSAPWSSSHDASGIGKHSQPGPGRDGHAQVHQRPLAHSGRPLGTRRLLRASLRFLQSVQNHHQNLVLGPQRVLSLAETPGDASFPLAHFRTRRPGDGTSPTSMATGRTRYEADFRSSRAEIFKFKLIDQF